MTTDIAAGLLPQGLRDRLPPQAAAADALMRGLIDRVAAHGYDRVQPPLVEYEEGLAGRLGGASRQELLRFVDPVSQRTLALRSDMTGQVGRIAATRLAHYPRPLRLAYGGPVVRVKGTQLNPERESLQMGAELIGSDSVAAVNEVLGLAVEALTAAGLTGLTIDLTLPNFVAQLADVWPVADLAAVQAELDGKDIAGLHAAGGARYAPLIAAAGPAASALAALSALGLGGALAAQLEATARVVGALGDAHAVTLDPTERHGFEYQSWIGFSFFATGVRGEVGRGGAYSVMHPGGSAEPAVGFSLYVDGLVEAGLGITPTRRIWLPRGAPADAGAQLRADGWITVGALDGEAMPPACTHRWTPSGPHPVDGELT